MCNANELAQREVIIVKSRLPGSHFRKRAENTQLYTQREKAAHYRRLVKDLARKQ